ncbi:unnamed protein product [Microthlaspi erraticum]|uniref:CCHC-type domain-containing protein n=1 Tax=Microthlaspi erraticum TaxID=1685480 RepID=A0A6D2JST8_9BRAS|nr:unnamed protein product [Microthlaspi erraticum]
MYVMDLPRHFFMVRFEQEEEYLAALTGGPWRVFGSYLMIQAWTPDFDPTRDEIETTPVWVRLANLPINFYHRSILMGIAKGLGKPLKVDSTTLHCERARFARVCVEVNLKKPLKGTILVKEERYFVSYEGLTNICSKCGLYGHLVHSCPQARMEKESAAAPRVEENPQSEMGVQANGRREDEGFTMVGDAGRREEPVRQNFSFAAKGTKRKAGNVSRVLTRKVDSANIALSNSFGRLGEDLDFQDLRQKQNIGEENKENEDTQNLEGRETREIQGSTRGGKNPKFQKAGKPGTYKALGNKGVKPNGAKSSGPTRGLIFGPTREEVDRLSRGKRLRVESMDLGRPGGSFVQQSSGNDDGGLPA